MQLRCAPKATPFSTRSPVRRRRRPSVRYSYASGRYDGIVRDADSTIRADVAASLQHGRRAALRSNATRSEMSGSSASSRLVIVTSRGESLQVAVCVDVPPASTTLPSERSRKACESAHRCSRSDSEVAARSQTIDRWRYTPCGSASGRRVLRHRHASFRCGTTRQNSGCGGPKCSADQRRAVCPTSAAPYARSVREHTFRSEPAYGLTWTVTDRHRNGPRVAGDDGRRDVECEGVRFWL